MQTPGMFVYHASEKDCVGQDGEGVQECVICFEEFAVGDEMGRLVCLCKFHRVSLQLLQLGGCNWSLAKGLTVRPGVYTAMVGYERCRRLPCASTRRNLRRYGYGLGSGWLLFYNLYIFQDASMSSACLEF